MSSYYSIVFCSKTWQTSSTYSVSYLISSLFQSLSTSCVKVSIAKSNGRKKFVHVHHKIIDSQISSIYRFNICNSYYYIHYHRDELSSIIAHNYGIVIVQNGFHSDENDAYVLPVLLWPLTYPPSIDLSRTNRISGDSRCTRQPNRRIYTRQ